MDPRDQTFMTIHNLSPSANILFASESICDILGYQPQEVQGRSCFEYFHPDEVPFARSVHKRGILLDKAAVLHYARILAKDGRWVSCECCFTVVHDVLVACTSIYLRGERSKRRAIDAPQIRRIFSCSPRDPRYHMLEHLSPKFKMPPMEREPRAALILNRFTRNLSIMFATNAVSTILGLEPEELKDKSFYECIQENCLQDAIRCLESAKANESIAYLRFWFRDPRSEDDDAMRDDEVASVNDTEDDETESQSSGGGMVQSPGHLDCSSRPDDGRFELDSKMELDIDDRGSGIKNEYGSADEYGEMRPLVKMEPSPQPGSLDSPVYDRGVGPYQPSPSAEASRPRGAARQASLPRSRQRSCSMASETFELEAVVSCTSDGLVVVLRRARPPIPPPHPPLVPIFNFENGLFAAPWGQQPIQPYFSPDLFHTFQSPLLPQYMPVREHVKAAGGPPMEQLMNSIRDVAVFAWAVVGINSNMATYGRGFPRSAGGSDGSLQGNDCVAQVSLDAGRELPRRWSYPDLDKESGLRHGYCRQDAHSHTTARMEESYYKQTSLDSQHHDCFAQWSDSATPFISPHYQQPSRPHRYQLHHPLSDAQVAGQPRHEYEHGSTYSAANGMPADESRFSWSRAPSFGGSAPPLQSSQAPHVDSSYRFPWT
ncbi:hypothetical protein VTK73DRAFT_6957 [Phialemonium thermophilum]|uniref:PAS domain-containing protein n=1 Tax=Phialemonium thermophilum TaxID=223376 RepID=A0ABR3XUQ9_9PEZI